MLKRHKDLLRPLVANLRVILAGTAGAEGTWQRGDLDRELERLGIAPDGTAIPIDALPNPTAAERRARVAADAYLTAAVNGLKGTEAEQKHQAAREEFVERAAYTWINRLLALRTMEARDLIDETLRANPDYEGISEALFVLRQTDPARCAGADGGWWAVIADACTAQAVSLPGLFDLSDPSVALRPSTAALLRCVALIGGAPAGFTLEEAGAAFADPDAIGWAYQFYQEAAKARVYEKLGSGGKAATRAEIAAATQLFTEPYMVQWLLQNSLGRSYHEAYPDSKLPESWTYYIRQRPEGQTAPESPRPLEALDLIDPCCGSGHFLREAFDMFAAMYRERHPELSAAEVADRILERHLHGIDIDPRAAQLAALTLYLRAWELVRDERRAQRQPGASSYRPVAMNIATTPSGLNAGALQRHLRRHPQDRLLKPLLEGVFAALEQADILGSLLRPAEHIEAAMKALQQPHTIPMDFDADDAALRRTITTMARHDPAELKRMLLDRVAQSFAAESGNTDDVAAQLFGREAERGVRLLQLLDRKYAVVVTNPPYLGSRNMNEALRKYVERHYTAGKRDLYSAFILRAIELIRPAGRGAMVTQQSWMFLRSFADLRAVAEDKLPIAHRRKEFTGLLREARLESLAHLGSNAFVEVSGEVVQIAMFTVQNQLPQHDHSFIALRLSGFRNVEEKISGLLRATNHKEEQFRRKQFDFLSLEKAPITYWLLPAFLNLLRYDNAVGQFSYVRQGICTTDNVRFVHNFWEISPNTLRKRWFLFAKGGGARRWSGFDQYVVDWGYDGARVKSFQEDTPGAIHWSGRMPAPDYLFKPGWTFARVSGGTLAVREIPLGSLFGHTSPAAIPFDSRDLPVLGYWLNTRLYTYLLRALTQSLNCQEGYVQRLPLPKIISFERAASLIEPSLSLRRRMSELDMTESLFSLNQFEGLSSKGDTKRTEAFYLTIEGYREILSLATVQLHETEISVLYEELGPPVGSFPLISGYDMLPELPTDLDSPPLPQEVTNYLVAHQRISPSPIELARIKARLRAHYEAGPGVTTKDDEAIGDENGGEDDEGEGAVSGAHIPIPTETFLEELSVKMQLHPISTYWLLEELRREGARCKPEEQRLLENRLSVLVLRLLGHRWPKQIEASEPVPAWADLDGIIPITPGTGEATLAERLRARLRAEDGDLGVQRTEALLAELTGLTLEEWARRRFFDRHIRQFKYRPVAWHLASTPPTTGKGRKGGRRLPAFECMLYYHACGGDVLARIRTQYVEPLLRAERQHVENARRVNDETAAALATERIQELEAFAAKLRHVAGEGFACLELDKLLENEPLDRWSGDGYLSPAERDELLRQERAWRVDLNDGVRVNIAPVQLAGLIVSDVLKAADARKAIADRARWRSDERRWVRAGKLPRCGWMDERVPESQMWATLAPQREAERMRLEEKRKAVARREREETAM